FGYVAVENKVDPATLMVNGVSLEEQDRETLVETLQANVSAGLFRRFEHDLPFDQRSAEDVYALIQEFVVSPRIEENWTLYESLFARGSIAAVLEEELPNAELQFRSWLSLRFVRSQQSSYPEIAGVRTAILGSLWTIAIAIIFALPVGVSAAIYL